MTSRFVHQNNWFNKLIPTLIMFVILIMPMTNIVSGQSDTWYPEEEETWISESTFSPDENQTFIDTYNNSLLEIPRNHTITEANLSISSFWNHAPYQNSTFGANELNQWNGSSVNLALDNDTSLLALATTTASNIIEDFEVTSPVPSGGWLSLGHHGDRWTIVNNNTTIITSSNMNLPNNGIANTSFLATTGLGDLGKEIDTCILSPQIEIPRVVNNYSLSFNHWLALDVTDTIGLYFLDEHQTWAELHFSNNLQVKSNSDAWESVNISLDGKISQSLTATHLKFCLSTSETNIPRGGWFIDHLEIYNQGDVKGAWFHGNFSGDYLPYAASEFILPANLSNFPYLDELEININWDIQGYIHDYLTVDFSFDDGKSWNPISGNYGIPGLGVLHNGNLYYTESGGWIPIYLPIIHNFTNSGGLNHTLFKFTVYTNAGINYGGTSSSSWEGIAIDQLVFHEKRGSNQQQSLLFKDFNNPPSIGLNSTDGWLESIRPANNQWQWTQTMGLSTEQYELFSFNDYDDLPLGWAISSRSDDQWEHGKLPTNKIYGPNVWSSGEHGVGISLAGKYANEMYTHLISPEYSIPANSSAKLSFSSWVCTESNWDGGAVSVSTNDGRDWWYLPPQLNGFHDQISTANTNSPLYGKGIFDGSNVVNTCRNSSLPFELKEYDVSNLSGHQLRFRYSFFSDQLIELDGWYIDDAGIVVDIFKSNGSWLSEPIYPDPKYGWGQIDGLVSEPKDTKLRFEIIDTSSGETIPGYSDLTLPIELRINPAEYPSIQIQANLSSTNHFVTPTLTKLEMGVKSYFNSYHAKHLVNNKANSQELIIDDDGIISVTGELDFSRLISIPCPSIDAKITTDAQNITFSSDSFSVGFTHYTDDMTHIELINNDEIPAITDNISITLDKVSMLGNFQYQPECVLPSENITIALDEYSNYLHSDLSSFSTTSSFFTDSFSSVAIGEEIYLPDIYGNYVITLEPNSVLDLTYEVLDYTPPNHNSNNITLGVEFEVESLIEGDLRFLSGNQPVFNYSTRAKNHHLITNNGCQNPQILGGIAETNVAISSCKVSIISTSAVDLKIISMRSISPVSDFTVRLDPLQLNNLKLEIENTSISPSVNLPVIVKTDFGSVSVSFDYRSYLHHIDRIVSVDEPRWLPGRELTIRTSHVRFNPLSMSETGYSFNKIELVASPDLAWTNAVFVIEATQLYSISPTFNIVYGDTKLAVNQEKSTISCNEGYCSIDWVLQSTWSLDDIDDVSWMVKSTDVNGLTTGPSILQRQTQYNEIENDIEVFELSVYDPANRDISDWTSQNWPYRFSENNILSVNGKIRFEGITDAGFVRNDAEVEIRMTAIPPDNISGGIGEWPDGEVNWSYSWFTEVESGGMFSTEISTPDSNKLPSNTSVQISAHISRVGPSDEVAQGARDVTSPNIKTKFIFDNSKPIITSIKIYDPAGLVDADGHTWTLNQDIPIQVVIEDMEGLSTELVAYTWAEYADDTNGDSIMDANEYRTTTVSVNYASNIATLDIPAISWQEVKGPFESGRLSIVLAIDDLAGNSLQNGGDFGADNDAATIIVQDQLQTLLDTSALSLDLIDGKLLPSYQHTFTYAITDFNGIESIDKIAIAILGRESPQLCFIDYYPRANSVKFDDQCYENEPIISVAKIPGMQKWVVETRFVVSWSSLSENPDLSGIPSLKIFDDGQDLQLGTSYIRGLSWELSTEVMLGEINLIDNTEPIGSTTNSAAWASPGDSIVASTTLYHNGTDITLGSISQDHQLGCLINGEEQSHDALGFNNGQLSCAYEIPEEVTDGAYEIMIWVLSDNATHNSTKVGIINIDSINPVLQLELTDLLRLNSNQLDRVLFQGEVAESSPIMVDKLYVNWNLIRNGSSVNTKPYSHSISINQSSFGIYYFSEIVNLSNTGQYSIVTDDILEIWLSFSDNAGQSMTGFATYYEPLLPKITWYDFVPKLTLVELRTETPTNGEPLIIATRIVNNGLESGNVTVSLVDDSGTFLGKQEVYLEGKRWELVEWNIEAWTTGDIQIIISLENHSQSEMLLIDDVAEFNSKQGELIGTLGLVFILSVIIIGGFSYAYLQRSKQLEQYTKHHLEQIEIRKQEKLLNLQRSDNGSEEE